jgi:hypothetical protein
MFGSQAIETAIGLAVLFFVIAAASSAIVEAFSRVLSKRAQGLEQAIGAMLTGGANSDAEDITAALSSFKGTSIYQAAMGASGKSAFRKKFKRPSYLSAKSFVDALTEAMSQTQSGSEAASLYEGLPVGLKNRLRPILLSTRGDVLRARAGLEQWFDETMSRVEGAYKRWASMWLFVVGLVIVVSSNASTFKVADRLYSEPATRAAVVEAATTASNDPGLKDRIKNAADATAELTQLKLPVGWDQQTKDAITWPSGKERAHQWRVLLVLLAGWITTALLVMLGAPFWFDVLSKLVSLRGAGQKPAEAKDDPTSSSALSAKRLSEPSGGPLSDLGLVAIDVAESGASPASTASVDDRLNAYLQRMLGHPGEATAG